MNVQEDSHEDPSPETSVSTNGTGPLNSKGWDGKLRVDKRAVVSNAEILSDPEYSDEDAPPVDQISADEGRSNFCYQNPLLTFPWIDLLEDYESDTDVRTAN